MSEEVEKKPIAKCWVCEKEFFHNNEFVVVRWTPSCIGSYCFECNPSNDGGDDD